MESSEQIYSYFLTALRHFVSLKGQNFFAVSTGRSDAWISKLLKPGTSKKAGFDLQVAIANAVDLGYENFIEIGRKLEKVISEFGKGVDYTEPKKNTDPKRGMEFFYEKLNKVIEQNVKLKQRNAELKNEIKDFNNNISELIKNIMINTKPPEGIEERRACAAQIDEIFNKCQSI